jgi:hypothetical protein
MAPERVNEPVGLSMAVGLAILAFSLSACGAGSQGSPGNRPDLVTLGTANANELTEPHVRSGRDMLFGSMILCLDSPGTVTVDAVRAVRPTPAFRVVEYGLRPSPFWTGGTGIIDSNGSLATNGFPANHTVGVTCDEKTGRGYELGVVVQRTGESPASMHGFKILYSSAGDQGEVTFPLSITLCPARC